MASTDLQRGLAQADAAQRLRDEGYNELAAGHHRSLWRIALAVLREPMFLLLMGAGLIYLLTGDRHEAAILLGFIVVIMTVTTLQEHRTERTLQALRDLSSPRALVLRDGTVTRIPGREVVRGDLLLLNEGDRVPADGVVLEAHELQVDESLLTGESIAVAKQAWAVLGLVAEAQRVAAGTLVVGGQGRIEVTATGDRTALGHIKQSLQDIDPGASPLQREMAALTRRLAIVGLALCLLLTALVVWQQGDWLAGLLAGITLAMGILPQEFPVILIVFLALGARRIAHQQVLTRHLSAIETLGETTVLCVDKTGTLTQNRMAVAALYADGETWQVNGAATPLPERFHALVEYGVLASEIAPHDPMEQAFHRLAGNYLANTEHLHPDWALVREYELSTDLLAMSHLWQSPAGQQVVAAKGAPEAIADLCHLDSAAQQTLAQAAEQMADQGLRVLGFAKAIHSGAHSPDIQHDFDFEFLGLLGLADPMRPEVPAAIRQCHRAGIRVVMITGDHPRTARAIARQAGIADETVLTGAELEQLSTKALAEACGRTSVFARVSPQQKLAIVNALKQRGEVVAMTGDGVNDAPALKAAHIGIAMGRRGTDVAREAASLVLLEDDFSAIVAAVGLGRRIFANLRQAMVYTLGVHIPIIGLSLLPLLLGLPPLLAPIHIAFLELVIDPTCSVVLEAEPAAAAQMAQPPRRRNAPLLSAGTFLLSALLGSLATLAALAVYGGALATDWALPQARALAFITLIGAITTLLFSSRRASPSLGGGLQGLSTVGWLVVVVVLALLPAITGIEALASAFTFQPPGILAGLAALALGLACYPGYEALKALFGSGRNEMVERK